MAVRAHLRSGSTAPEHRTAAVAFLHFGGLDEAIAREGAAGAGRRLDEVVRLVQDAVERYDVCFLDSDIASDGRKIRLSAGAPRVVGDDEERMLLALRHIVAAGRRCRCAWASTAVRCSPRRSGPPTGAGTR